MEDICLYQNTMFPERACEMHLFSVKPKKLKENAIHWCFKK